MVQRRSSRRSQLERFVMGGGRARPARGRVARRARRRGRGPPARDCFATCSAATSTPTSRAWPTTSCSRLPTPHGDQGARPARRGAAAAPDRGRLRSRAPTPSPSRTPPSWRRSRRRPTGAATTPRTTPRRSERPARSEQVARPSGAGRRGRGRRRPAAGTSISGVRSKLAARARSRLRRSRSARPARRRRPHRRPWRPARRRPAARASAAGGAAPPAHVHAVGHTPANGMSDSDEAAVEVDAPPRSRRGAAR